MTSGLPFSAEPWPAPTAQNHDMHSSADTNWRPVANNKRGLGDPVLVFPAARVAEGVLRPFLR
jgi:hypothetical protein